MSEVLASRNGNDAMKIFITGATGFVGSSITKELVGNGHEVLGLARSDESAEKLRRMGATAIRGSLETLDALQGGAERADAIIHAGFVHDFARFKEACDIDRAAIETLGRAIKGTVKPMIVTAGVAHIRASGPLTLETDEACPPNDFYPRASEAAARALTESGVPVSVIRLPPSVHGRGDHAFIPMLIDLAQRTGRSAYIGTGANSWPAVHVKDAATCFRLAIEQGQAQRTLHAVAEQAIPFRDIAEAIAAGTGLPLATLSREEAEEHFGWFFTFASIDQPTSSEITQQDLGWSPVHATLLSDMKDADYFTTKSSI
jgi:nucleoside-diphosphate-sugar epimerase